MLHHSMPSPYRHRSSRRTKPPGQHPRRRRRAGVTAMEYLFMLSLIIVAVILAVQHIGSLTAQKLASTANKTAPAKGG